MHTVHISALISIHEPHHHPTPVTHLKLRWAQRRTLVRRIQNSIIKKKLHDCFGFRTLQTSDRTHRSVPFSHLYRHGGADLLVGDLLQSLLRALRGRADLIVIGPLHLVLVQNLARKQVRVLAVHNLSGRVGSILSNANDSCMRSTNGGERAQTGNGKKSEQKGMTLSAFSDKTS